jgi:hypothetical protein
METIFWISVGLFVVTAVAVMLMIREHNQMFGEEDPVPLDDTPGRYEDVEYCEQPFIEYL